MKMLHYLIEYNRAVGLLLLICIFFIPPVVYGSVINIIPFTKSISAIWLFIPFYLLGYYTKKATGRMSYLIERKIIAGGGIFVASLLLLYALFRFSSIPHTVSVGEFSNSCIMYWISGSVGIVMLLALSMMLNKLQSKIVTIISCGTLFIMCSHFEVFYRLFRFDVSDVVIYLICFV